MKPRAKTSPPYLEVATLAVHLLEMRDEVPQVVIPMASSSAAQQPSLPPTANQGREHQPLWVVAVLAAEVAVPQMPKQMTNPPSRRRYGLLPQRWPSRLRDRCQCPLLATHHRNVVHDVGSGRVRVHAANGATIGRSRDPKA